MFQSSHSIISHPLLFKFSVVPAPIHEGLIQVAFTVSTKSFKKAVLRNRIRRRMKEAYRLNWKRFLESKENTNGLHLMVIYLGKEVLSYDFIESSMIKCLQKVSDFMEKNKEA